MCCGVQTFAMHEASHRAFRTASCAGWCIPAHPSSAGVQPSIVESAKSSNSQVLLRITKTCVKHPNDEPEINKNDDDDDDDDDDEEEEEDERMRMRMEDDDEDGAHPHPPHPPPPPHHHHRHHHHHFC